MVYDWFTRSGAPENGDSPEPTDPDELERWIDDAVG